MSKAGQSIHDGNPLSHLVTVGGEWILRPLGFRRRRVHFQGIDMEVLEGRGAVVQTSFCCMVWGTVTRLGIG